MDMMILIIIGYITIIIIIVAPENPLYVLYIYFGVQYYFFIIVLRLCVYAYI